MIRSPAQLKLMALGLPDTPCNFGGKSSSSSASTNNTTTNTTTTYQDRRNVADGGSTVVSADQSTVFIQNTDQGAINAGAALGLSALDHNANVAGQAIDAAKVLAKTGADMASKTQDVTAQLFAGSQSLAAKAMAQDSAALQMVQSLASLPTKLNDPNRAIVIVGMAVVGVAAVYMLKKG